MSPTSSHSAREREAARERWAAFVRPHWKRLAYPGVLTRKETSVLSLRLGLTGAPVSQRVISRRYGISIATVATLELSARKKIGAALTREGQQP